MTNKIMFLGDSQFLVKNNLINNEPKNLIMTLSELLNEFNVCIYNYSNYGDTLFTFYDRYIKKGPLPLKKIDSYNREKDSTMSTFNITDNGKILKASYTGVLPDMFFSSKSEQIILEGKLVGNGELFEAENVIVKCPSKYEE